MKHHTINAFKAYDDVGRVLLRFDDDDRAELSDLVDLSPMLAQGGVFEPLRDPGIFVQKMEISPDGDALFWRTGPGEDDIVDLCADALWLLAHPEDRATAVVPVPGAPGARNAIARRFELIAEELWPKHAEDQVTAVMPIPGVGSAVARQFEQIARELERADLDQRVAALEQIARETAQALNEIRAELKGRARHRP